MHDASARRGTVDEHRRLTILQQIDEEPRRTANEVLIAMLLRRLGVGASEDRVRTDLVWLAEQGAVRVEDVGGVLIATLTGRGAEAARGETRIPGVARPGPDG